MPCEQPDFEVIQATVAATNISWASAFAAGQPNPFLILSDHPEVPSGDDSVLVFYRCAIPVPQSGEVMIRAFLWHKNETGRARKMWIACQIVGPSGGVSGLWSNHAHIRRIGEGEQSTGLCVAKGQLFGILDVASDDSGSIPSNGPGKLVGALAEEHELYGGVHEFTITTTPGSTLYIWTCFSDDDDVGGLGSDVQPSSDTHNRGSWPYANIICLSTEIQPLVSPSWYAFTVCGWDPFWPPADTFMFLKRPSDTYGTIANKGLYGVNVQYVVRVFVVGTWYFAVYLRSRNTGNYYQGAAPDQSDSFNPEKGVPPINYTAINDREGVRLIEEGTLTTGANNIVLPNCTGGGATMPCELLIVLSLTRPLPSPSQ